MHNRRSIRLKGYDYSRRGFYFITICCHEKEKRLGEVIDKKVIMNEFGEIAFAEWLKLSERFPNIILHEFIVMPNHIHGIIEISERQVGAALAAAPTIGNIIGAYKSLVFNESLKIYKNQNEGMGKLWQRNYYEHIIRTQESYLKIKEYILSNPEKWENDKFFID